MINLMIPENVRQAYGSNALKNAFPTRWILRFCMWEKWPGVGLWQQFCAAAGAPYSDIWEPASPRSKKHVRRQQHENSESTKNKGRQVSISHFEPGSILRDHAAELQKSWYSKKTLMANNVFWFFGVVGGMSPSSEAWLEAWIAIENTIIMIPKHRKSGITTRIFILNIFWILVGRRRPEPSSWGLA